MSDLYRYEDADLYSIMSDLRKMMDHIGKEHEETQLYLLGEVIAIKRELVKRWKPKDAA